MFSALGNIFTNRPREAETTDTRQAIRRHDPDQERSKKKKKDKTPEELFSTQDDASVSIEALRVFLESFLKSQQDQEEQKEKLDTKEDSLNSAPETLSPIQASGKAAQAASVYQSAALRNKPKSSLTIDETGKAAVSLGLEAHEIRTIHQLLDDLKDLSERGIEHLHIERSSSFLQSLVNAVAKLKIS